MTNPNSFTLDNVTLYHRPSCGYCMRVHLALKTMKINIANANVSRDDHARKELSQKGGKSQVPALRITHSNGKEEWMYESLDIIDYLQKQAG
ncbi:glutaredoxin family protein [Teredinibacter haidensis]|uniref:glutaredoxin family protein n=1 Tax=Teredinibacter haidensis TaxID=2731755 RepID=UPI000B0ABB86|nr:glutathione S-transferase N-terminal domain-containing protein [Teredinibacter haidensis]